MYPAFDYLFDPVAIVLNPYESKSGHLSHAIPGNAPLGTYTYHGYVGNLGVGVIDQDQFDFEAIEGSTTVGPEAPNASIQNVVVMKKPTARMPGYVVPKKELKANESVSKLKRIGVKANESVSRIGVKSLNCELNVPRCRRACWVLWG